MKPQTNPPDSGGPSYVTSVPMPSGKTRINTPPLTTSPTSYEDSTTPRWKTSRTNNFQSSRVRPTSSVRVHPRPKRTSSAKPPSHLQKYPWASRTLQMIKPLVWTTSPTRCYNWRAHPANHSSTYYSTECIPRHTSHPHGRRHISLPSIKRDLNKIQQTTVQYLLPAALANCTPAPLIPDSCTS